MRKRIKYEDLERHFTKPKDWEGGKQPFFGRHKRLPRKLKKLGKTWAKKTASCDYLSALWYRQHCLNPNYNRFLIKLVCNG
jgi:hypothetical protein